MFGFLICLIAVVAVTETFIGAYTGNVVLFGASLAVCFALTVGLAVYSVRSSR